MFFCTKGTSLSTSTLATSTAALAEAARENGLEF